MFDLNLQLSRRKVGKASYSGREVAAAEFIPYHHHYDSETIVTKNKEIFQIIRVDGFSFETADDEDVDMKKAVRNSLFKSMADGSIALWFHTIRRRKGGFPAGTMPPGFASFVNEKWYKKHHSKDSYVNELYISVIRKADTAGAAKFGHMLQKVALATDKASKKESLKDSHKELKEAVYRVLATLRDYGPRVLTTYEKDGSTYSEPLEFLSKIVNCGHTQRMMVPTGDISHYLPIDRLYFGNRAIEIRSLTKTRFAGILSIKEYGPSTAAGILDAYLQMPFELIVSQSYAFINRQVSIGRMQRQQGRMMNAGDPAITLIAEISEALDMTTSGHIAFGQHHMTVMVLEDSLLALENVVSMSLAELVNVGVNPVREKMVLEQCFWAQLPCNFSFIGRKSDINTMNLAAFVSLHNYPTGRIRGNHWGSAVTVFDTTSGTPYFFNFHLRDVGHTTIIGPTGAGKTVLMNFLCCQAQKFNCRLFFFDKDRGADIFIRSLGGSYNIIEPGERLFVQPLQLPDTLENRNFLAEWLRALVTVNDETFTAEDMGRVAEAVSGNYKLAQADRVLRNIAPFFGIEGPGTLAGRLRLWHRDGQYAGLFDNPVDTVDLSTGSVFGFEMGEVLANKATLAPVLLYLFHKVHLALDGTPTIVVLDEAWALIDNNIFASKIKDWLKTLRKLNALVVFATQSVEDATKSSISDTLVQQTATQIFLPNPKATDTYRTAFMLSNASSICSRRPIRAAGISWSSRGRTWWWRVSTLAGMEEVVWTLSGRSETVNLLDEIRKETGDDPQAWMPVFWERMRKGI